MKILKRIFCYYRGHVITYSSKVESEIVSTFCCHCSRCGFVFSVGVTTSGAGGGGGCGHNHIIEESE